MSKRIWFSLLVLVFTFVLVFGFVSWLVPDTDVQSTMSGMRNGDMETAVRDDIMAAEYAVSWQTSQDAQIGDAYQAPNRQQQFRTYFLKDGIVVRPREAQSDMWQWGLQLVSIGNYEVGEKTAVLSTSSNRVTYDWGAFSEWYINDERGLEQGFTVREPLSEGGKLQLDLSISGDLLPILREDGTGIDFISPKGGTLLHYSDLYAFDANGHPLPTSMGLVEHANQQAVRLSVDTVAAAYPITIDPLASSAAPWQPYLTQDGNFGFSVREAGDVNGDGYDDVIVGANWFDGGQNREGAAFLYYGSANGLSQTYDWMAESNQASAEMGYAVSTAGDIDDDLYDDLIIGAPGFDGTGAAFIFFGSANGPAAGPDIELPGEQNGSRFGHAVSTAGYVNDDFFADVIVGAPQYDGNWGAEEGRAYVYYGSSSGVSSSPDWIGEIDEQFSGPGAQFGFSVDTADDFDNNGYDDVVIGAPYYAPEGESGLMAVFPGSDVGLPNSMSTPPVATLPDSYYDSADFLPSELGYAVAGAGDVNNDGIDDVIVGAPTYDDFQGLGTVGAAYLYLGATDRFSGTFSIYDERILPLVAGSRFGHAVDGAGDINRDGFADLIIGAPQYDNTVTDEGAAFLYLGNLDISWSDFDIGYFGGQSNARFGTSVSTAYDTNGDRYDDFVVGAPQQTTPVSSVGQAFGFYGFGPITGLTAVNDGPALKNEAVHFEAAISAGGDVDYIWDFGDGAVGTGPKPNHRYADSGLYTAVVTVSNPLSVLSTTTVVSITVDSLISPETGGTLIFTNDQGQGTRVDVPPGAVNSVQTLSYTPLNENNLTQPKPNNSINYYFDLGPEPPRQTFLPLVANGAIVVANRGSTADLRADGADETAANCPAGHFCFLKPVLVTITYNEDLLPPGASEKSLTLTFWDELQSQWVDAATTCSPVSTYSYFPNQDYFTIEVCHLSRFGVIH